MRSVGWVPNATDHVPPADAPATERGLPVDWELARRTAARLMQPGPDATPAAGRRAGGPAAYPTRPSPRGMSGTSPGSDTGSRCCPPTSSTGRPGRPQPSRAWPRSRRTRSSPRCRGWRGPSPRARPGCRSAGWSPTSAGGCSASTTRSAAPPATGGCCSWRPTCTPRSRRSTCPPPTSGCGCACTRPPTGSSSRRCRGCATTSPTRSASSSRSRRAATAVRCWTGSPRCCARRARAVATRSRSSSCCRGRSSVPCSTGCSP